jgi:COP9 signalosome complex subunit 3
MSDHLYDESIKEQIESVKKIQQSKLLLQTSGGEHVLDVS